VESDANLETKFIQQGFQGVCELHESKLKMLASPWLWGLTETGAYFVSVRFAKSLQQPTQIETAIKIMARSRLHWPGSVEELRRILLATNTVRARHPQAGNESYLRGA